MIYRDAEGIKAGLPETSDNPTHCRRPREPEGTEPEAAYHNHRQTETFSHDDRLVRTTLVKYLCVPSGLVKKMTPEGMVIVQ